MASLYKKTINGKPYWYLREMARVGGIPKMISERYLGSAADIEALQPPDLVKRALRTCGGCERLAGMS